VSWFVSSVVIIVQCSRALHHEIGRMILDFQELLVIVSYSLLENRDAV
jgi:hypothetical protein